MRLTMRPEDLKEQFGFEFSLKKWNFRLTAEVLLLSGLGVTVIGAIAPQYELRQAGGVVLGGGADVRLCPLGLPEACGNGMAAVSGRNGAAFGGEPDGRHLRGSRQVAGCGPFALSALGAGKASVYPVFRLASGAEPGKAGPAGIPTYGAGADGRSRGFYFGAAGFIHLRGGVLDFFVAADFGRY